MKATIIHIEGDADALRAALDMLPHGALAFTTRSDGDQRFSETARQGGGLSSPRPLRDLRVQRPHATPPITDSTKCDRILDDCPHSMGELPAFFDRLTDRQLDSAWVACIIDCATRDSGRVVISQLAAACAAARDRYRAAAINHGETQHDALPEVPQADGLPQGDGISSQQADPGDGLPSPPTRHWPELHTALLAAIPEVGDEVRIRDFTPSHTERSTIRNHLMAKCDDERLQWVSGSRGGNTPARIRRIKP
jgi:hypothetical protein